MPKTGQKNCRPIWSVAATMILLMLVMKGQAQSSGEAIFKAKCQMCHGANGDGETPTGKSMKIKPFKDPILLKMSDATLIDLTKSGVGKMPAYKDKLTDAQLHEVVAYIHQLQKK